MNDTEKFKLYLKNYASVQANMEIDAIMPNSDIEEVATIAIAAESAKNTSLLSFEDFKERYEEVVNSK